VTRIKLDWQVRQCCVPDAALELAG
jgi:hypothetical protein